jgi:hypothetical protein
MDFSHFASLGQNRDRGFGIPYSHQDPRSRRLPDTRCFNDAWRRGPAGRPRKDILIADTPRSFADSVIRILEDRVLAARLAASLRNLVLRDFSVDSLAAQGKRILEYLSGNGCAGSTTNEPA